MSESLQRVLKEYRRTKPHEHLDYHDIPIPQAWTRESENSWICETGQRATIEVIDNLSIASIIFIPTNEEIWSNKTVDIDPLDMTVVVCKLVTEMYRFSLYAGKPSNRVSIRQKQFNLFRVLSS